MTKLLKRILLVLGGLAVLLAVGLTLVVLLVDPNEYKDDITKAVYETTGMELTIEGNLELRVFPWIGVDTGAVRLGNPPGFGDEPFVSLQSASVSLQVLPLLSGSVQAGQIDVQGLRLNLLRNADGAANWEALGKKDAAETAPAEEQPQSGADKAGQGLDLAIGGLNVTDANILFDDRQAGKRFALEGLNLRLGEVQPGQPFDMKVSLGLESSQPPLGADIQVQAVAALDLAQQVYELNDLQATVQARGEAVPGGETTVQADARTLLADLGRQVVTTEGLTLNVYGVTLNAELAASDIKSAPRAKGTLRVDPFDAKKLLTALGQTPPETTDPTALGNVSLALGFDYGPDAATVHDLILNLDGQEITGEASMIAGDVPAYDVKIQADSLNLDPYRAPQAEEPAETEAETDPQTTPAGQDEKPLLPKAVAEQLRSLRLDALLKVGQLKASPAELSDLLILITARDGLLKVEPASFTLYEGDLTSSMSMDVRGTIPNYALNLDLNGLAIGPLLQAIQGKESLSGRTNAETALTVRGNTLEQLKRTLSGNVRFDIHDGVFPGVDLAGVMTKAYRKLESSGDGEIQTQEDARTQFGLVSGSATITNGLVDNRDFLFKSPFLQADGEGVVSLPENSVNYLVVGALLASTEGQGRGDKADYVGIGIPIRVKGDFDDLHFWPDPVKWAEMIAGGALNILGDGAETVLDTPGALLDAVGGLGSKNEGAAKEEPTQGAAPDQSSSSNPLDEVEKGLKGLF
ncbi:AsmA protein [Paucidesulfovibrio gracilis DSM 16080]|uniref:AsmA protein n=1 Tax=Paucidesulfovibrio gracilis DSM 16080 TaxID=1121449 RepID=A0A1T4X3E8_9BACT|nr:AsmA family protein [Paucidesulfovibrio gracilis]SKA83678.1 AsmA protein [Paucidesulfovibrio gracilis DSM 16080]